MPATMQALSSKSLSNSILQKKAFLLKIMGQTVRTVATIQGMEKGEVYPGIGICGSGEGIAMTLNKHQNIRAGLAWIPEIAHLIRQHNNANVLVMPGRFINQETAKKILDEFFETDFEGGRHQNRIDKIPVKE